MDAKKQAVSFRDEQQEQFTALYRALKQIRRDTAKATATKSSLAAIATTHQRGAKNLLHYLALRRHDLRPLQTQLVELGLTSLGQVESHVLASLDNVLYLLKLLTHKPDASGGYPQRTFHFEQAKAHHLLKQHTLHLLGPAPENRDVRIMVTLPSEAAHDYMLVYQLLKAGMNCARINCAHDDPYAWQLMLQHLKKAKAVLKQSCRVMMDLAGPKLRTGAMMAGPQVLHVRPRRDRLGQILQPARLWLTTNSTLYVAPSITDGAITVDAGWLSQVSPQDLIVFRDARDCRRQGRVIDVTPDGAWVEFRKSAYIVPSTRLELHACHAGDNQAPYPVTRVSDLPHLDEIIPLQRGDDLILTHPDIPGKPATYDQSGILLTPAHIGCTIPAIFTDVQVGEPIWFDDGKIGGRIVQVEAHQIKVNLTHLHPEGDKLRPDKGINLPESELHLAALTAQDLAYLPFVVEHADVIELSFANSAADVDRLHEEVQKLTEHPPGLVLKIETQSAFNHLPELIFSAMRNPVCGIMIARGDLAVECGFERLAEVQEEILWLCEAAHIPVIWATQVLESLAKSGLPSRAEITDAAMGHRAECVMLNKGPYVLDAVNTLDDIIQRMQDHQSKKLSMLRALHVAGVSRP